MGIPKPYVPSMDIDKMDHATAGELYDYAWNTSLYHFVTKPLTGLSIGIIASVILFKRKTWPIALFTGGGLGMAYSEANHSFWTVERKLALRSSPQYNNNPAVSSQQDNIESAPI